MLNSLAQDYEYEYRDEDPEGTAAAAPYVSQQYDQTPPLPDDGGQFSKPYNDYAEQPPNDFLPDATAYEAPSLSNPADPNPSPWPLTHSHSDLGTTTVGPRLGFHSLPSIHTEITSSNRIPNSTSKYMICPVSSTITWH